MDTVSDRLRIPWLRGAKKVNISILPPLILLPVFLRVASWHFLLGVVVLTSLPVLALWYYYLTHRRKEQTLFFLSLGLFSLGYMYYVFLQEVVPRGRVGPTRLALLTCGLFLILLALCRAKKNPGYLRSPAGSERPGSGGPAERPGPGGQDKARGPLSSRAPREELRGPPGVPAGSPAKVKEDWCAKCQLVRPARAWHCRICGICVRRMDHHCVWYVGRTWRLAEGKAPSAAAELGLLRPPRPPSRTPARSRGLLDVPTSWAVLPASHAWVPHSFPEGPCGGRCRCCLALLFRAPLTHFLLRKTSLCS